MTTVNKWEIYCDTEAAIQTVWSETSPTVCPNNNGHTVDLTSVKKVEIFSGIEVEIEEQIIDPTLEGTNKRFILESVGFDIPPQTTTSVEASNFPFNVLILQGYFFVGAQHEGDTLSLISSPDKEIGNITQNVDIGDTVINVDSSVIDSLVIGYYVYLYDGVTTEPECRVTAIDKHNSTITLETATINAFLTVTPTKVRRNVYVFKDMELSKPGLYSYHDKTKKGALKPAGSPSYFYYTNNSISTQKRFVRYLEYYY